MQNEERVAAALDQLEAGSGERLKITAELREPMLQATGALERGDRSAKPIDR